jgi:hypothetical protein
MWALSRENSVIHGARWDAARRESATLLKVRRYFEM